MASAAVKEGSYFPQTTRVGGCASRSHFANADKSRRWSGSPETAWSVSRFGLDGRSTVGLVPCLGPVRWWPCKQVRLRGQAERQYSQDRSGCSEGASHKIAKTTHAE